MNCVSAQSERFWLTYKRDFHEQNNYLMNQLENLSKCNSNVFIDMPNTDTQTKKDEETNLLHFSPAPSSSIDIFFTLICYRC